MCLYDYDESLINYKSLLYIVFNFIHWDTQVEKHCSYRYSVQIQISEYQRKGAY